MELWKDIEGYEGLYQVSNMGRVKHLNFNNTGREKVMKPASREDRYTVVSLCKGGKKKNCYVHRLVACAFIPNTDGKEEIDHINTIRTDNRVDNLRWATHKENNNNVLTRPKHAGANNPKARKVLQFTKEGVFIREWDCIRDASRKLGVGHQHISSCCLGKRKIAYGFVWKYA